MIREREVIGVDQDVIGVVHPGIAGDTPGFMANDTVAMLTGGRGAVFVAVKQRGGMVEGHVDLTAKRASSSVRPLLRASVAADKTDHKVQDHTGL
jgi:hypothetical protein